VVVAVVAVVVVVVAVQAFGWRMGLVVSSLI
jgi:hypothetical protein